METSSPQIDEILTTLQNIPLEYWLAVAAGLVLLIVIIKAAKSGGNKQRAGIAPKIVLSNFQLAPLGRDAFLKLSNEGETATLSKIQITGRNDVVIKNDIAGQQITKGGSYSILLEANADKRLQANFSIELVYIDQQRNAYKQTFSTATQASSSIKRTKV